MSTTDHEDISLSGDIHTGLVEDEAADTRVLIEPSGTATTVAGGAAVGSIANHAVWNLAFYQAYFDVDTTQVVRRIKLAALPLKPTLMAHMKDYGGDLYGPFWISTTLIFVLAIAGNLAHYKATPEDKRAAWHYNFSKVSVAATVIYVYATLIPLSMWIWFRIYHSNHRPNLFDIFCLYGYSLFPYAPVSLLCAFPFIDSGGQWALLGIIYASSCTVMLRNLQPYLKELPPQQALIALTFVLAPNAALCIAFKFYFFVYP